MSTADVFDGVVVVGLHHRNAPPALRDSIFAEDPDRAPLLADVRAAGIAQAVVLATCERIEIAAVTADSERAERDLAALIARWTGSDARTLGAYLTIRRGPRAVRQIFAVASALDSQVPGEPQILGQVKDSHRCAVEAGLVGPELESVLEAAYGAAKRVRSETALSEQPVSIAAAAVKVARQVHGDLRRASALLLGLGEMAEIMAAQLRDSGIGEIALVHPVARRAEAAARRLGVQLRSWSDLEGALAQSDIVVAALGGGPYTITEAMQSRVLKRRRQRPMFIMDAAVPSDVEPAVEDLDPAFVYDLDDLERVAAHGLAQRESAAVAAWRLVDAELDAFQRRQSARDAAPVLTALGARLEALRSEILSEGNLDADAATRLLIKRILHDPSRVLREAAESDGAELAELERSLRRLFRTEQNTGSEPGQDDKEGR